MGEIAEDMIDGTCCMGCGVYFVEKGENNERLYAHGYPVICTDCWEELTPREQKDSSLMDSTKCEIL